MLQPWAAAGFECVAVDTAHDTDSRLSPRIMRFRRSVTEFKSSEPPAIVFAFPPCTHLAVSGARWFRDKGMGKLIEALTLVEACRKLCEDSGAPWMLENPVGTLATYWREPDYRFDPCDFAGWADDPDSEAYTKRTCLWTGGGFVYPHRRWVEPTLGSLFHRTPPGPDRGDIRSVTPQGFARAVFDANVEQVRERAA